MDQRQVSNHSGIEGLTILSPSALTKVSKGEIDEIKFIFYGKARKTLNIIFFFAHSGLIFPLLGIMHLH